MLWSRTRMAAPSTFTVPSPVTLTLAYNGRARDKVGGGDTALAPDNALDGTITLMLSAAGGRTVTALEVGNGIGGVWNTIAPDSFWLLGVARSLDEPLLNDATTMAVNVFVADGGLLTLFGSDYLGGMGFAPGRILTVTATFADGTSAVGMVVTQ